MKLDYKREKKTCQTQIHEIYQVKNKIRLFFVLVLQS